MQGTESTLQLLPPKEFLYLETLTLKTIKLQHLSAASTERAAQTFDFYQEHNL